MNYLRGGCAANRMENESNVNVNTSFSVDNKRAGMSFGVVELVQCSTLR